MTVGYLIVLAVKKSSSTFWEIRLFVSQSLMIDTQIWNYSQVTFSVSFYKDWEQETARTCTKSDKLPQVMSLESALLGAEGDRSENVKKKKKNVEVWS